MDTFAIADYKKTIEGLLKELPSRTENVLARRFGMENDQNNLDNENQGETLEEIGKDYRITRERVRQIENKGLESIQKSPKFPKLKGAFLKLKYFIDENGGLKREDVLKSNMAIKPQFSPYLLFVLRLGKPFSYQPESSSFYPLWKTHEEAPKIADQASDLLVKLMEEEKRLFKIEEILGVGKKEVSRTLKINLKKNYLISYIEATKKIEENPFGEYGPACWSEVRPKSSGSRACLVLKKEKRPIHFKELAELIEKELHHPVRANTLHNELIKSDQFVLVGRGTYALKEWGYKDGTVREIIENILKEKGELSKEEVITEIKKQRMVKETTILLSLRYFKKTEKGKYMLG